MQNGVAERAASRCGGGITEHRVGGHLATVWTVLVAKEVPLWRHYEAVGYWSSSRHQESANHRS